MLVPPHLEAAAISVALSWRVQIQMVTESKLTLLMAQEASKSGDEVSRQGLVALFRKLSMAMEE